MKARRRQGPDGMPSGVELVVGSRASVSMVDRSLVGSTKAPLMNQDAMGQAAQALSASSWGPRNPDGSPAGASYAGACWTPATVASSTVASTVLGDVLQLAQPTVILKALALQEHETPLQASGADGPREVLQPTPPQPTQPQPAGAR